MLPVPTFNPEGGAPAAGGHGPPELRRPLLRFQQEENVSQHSCVLIESPGWRDASFYGKWLLTAAEAQRLWREAVQSDCEFRSRIERLEVVSIVLLGNEALKVIGELAENDICTLIVRVDTELGDSVALLAPDRTRSPLRRLTRAAGTSRKCDSLTRHRHPDLLLFVI